MSYVPRMFETSFLTLYPEAFPGPLGVSILERARKDGIWDWETVDLREFGIGEETRRQLAEAEGRETPDAIVACVGGGSNAIGIWAPFVDDAEVRLVGAEAAGEGLAPGQKHAATLAKGSIAVFHGSRSFLLQDHDGQVIEPHSISAGLDYPGVGPEHAYLKDAGRVEVRTATDAEALEGLHGGLDLVLRRRVRIDLGHIFFGRGDHRRDLLGRELRRLCGRHVPGSGGVRRCPRRCPWRRSRRWPRCRPWRGLRRCGGVCCPFALGRTPPLLAFFLRLARRRRATTRGLRGIRGIRLDGWCVYERCHRARWGKNPQSL